jgi:flagellar biosynthesis protein FlhG
MFDQAKQLRQLMRDTGRLRLDEDTEPERIVVTGAKGGVGATTLAVQLAAELARRGRRVVLVDADLPDGDLAAMCHTEACVGNDAGLAEVLAGQRNIHDVLRRGPLGLQIVAHHSVQGPMDALSLTAGRVLHHLDALNGHVETFVIDAGCASTHFGRQLAQAATHWLLATTADDVSVMDAYAAFKLLATERSETLLPKACLIVNRATDDEAEAIGNRLRRTAQRFLNAAIDIHVAAVPDDTCVVDAGRTGRPLVLQSPRSSAARAVERLAATLATPPTGHRRMTASVA